MKRYLVGLVALLLAVGFSAFTIPAKKSLVDPVIFEYMAPGGSYDENDVESTSTTSWQPNQSADCDDTNVRACSITVPLSQTVGGLGLALDGSKVTITAAGSASIFRVSNVAVQTGSASFVNKQ